MYKFTLTTSVNTVDMDYTCYNEIYNQLLKYFADANYNINIVDITTNANDISKLEQVTRSNPDAFIYINFLPYFDGIFISMYDQSVITEQSLKFANKLDDQLSNLVDLHKYDITYDKSYMNRLRVFPSITINIGLKGQNYDYMNTLNAQKSLAKAIYLSVISSFTVPKNNETYEFVTTGNLNMKEHPTKNAKYLVTVPKNSIVEVLEKTNNIYWLIRADVEGKSYIGYCAQTYIVMNKLT